jgi:hypothetical protein
MSSPNPFVQLLPDINTKPQLVPAEPFGKNTELDKEALRLLKQAGVTAETLTRSIQSDVKVSYERFNLYQELHRASEHWFVGPCLDLYANVATTYNPVHNATVWVTSPNDSYAKALNSFLDSIGIEEKIYDWTYSVCEYGDLFIKLVGIPGLGVVSVDDSMHPMHLSRVEVDGILVGFYNTPQGMAQGVGSAPVTTGTKGLIPPWDYVHFRLLGAKKKRPRFQGDNTHSEMRQVHLITGAETKQTTTRYGTSLAVNALPSYKRLRLAEDSLLLARVTRGIIKYLWKMKVDSTNMEAVAATMDQYATLITRARAVDSRASSASYDSKQNPLTAIEDIFIPVWGDVNDLTYEKIGGEADIRWIVDVDMLRNQLAFALACSPSLGGAFTKEASGALGSEALSEIGIRFARSARRVQRALISGIVRMCQIHLAYLGMDPDPNLFTVHMSETSSVEETQILKGMEGGMKTLVTMLKTLKLVAGKRIDPLKVWDYFNEKLLRLEDFNITDFFKSKEVLDREIELERELAAKKKSEEEAGRPTIKAEEPKPPAKIEGITIESEEELDIFVHPISLQEALKRQEERANKHNPIGNLDLASYFPAHVPLVEKKGEEKSVRKKLAETINVKESGENEKLRIAKAIDNLMEVKLDSKTEDAIPWIQERDAAKWHSMFGNAQVKITEGISEDSEEKEEVAV